MPSQTVEEANGHPARTGSSPFRLGFRPPAPATDDLLSDPIPSPASPPPGESPLPADLAPDSADEWLSDEHDEAPASTSSPASTPVASPLNNDGLKEMARGAVLIAGDQAHRALARTPGQQEVGLYRTDAEDAAGIGDPLARIAGRHQGVGKVNPDTADFLASMMGIARYATKQIGASAEARRIDAAGGPAAAPAGPVDL